MYVLYNVYSVQCILYNGMILILSFGAFNDGRPLHSPTVMTLGGVRDVAEARPWLLVISNMRIKVVVVSFTTLAARDLLRLRNHKTCPETLDSSSSIFTDFKHFGFTKQIK